MFEAYTEKARRAIFEGRLAASKLGGHSIELPHLLLGLLEADRPLAVSLFKSEHTVEEVRQRVVEKAPKNIEKAAPKVDLPLSHDCKLALAHAAEECRRLSQAYISVEHLFLGILREDSSTSRILLDNGLTVAQLEAVIDVPPKEPVRPLRFDGLRDLVAEAHQGNLDPMIGRENELDQMIRILVRRTRNSVVLIGEAGVGKDALVQGLAQRIADGNVPAELADRHILQLHISQLASVNPPEHSIVYIRGLFDTRIAIPGWLKEQRFQIIATGAPLGFRLALDRAEELARRFEVVSVLAPSEDEASAMIRGRKEAFERFHRVAISEDAIEVAITASGRFLPSRSLPDRALDLLDEASSRVKLRLDRLPPDVARIKSRLRAITKQMEYELGNHHFEKVRQLAEDQRQQEENLAEIQLQHAAPKQDNIVRREDVLDALSARAGVAVDAVKATLARPQEADLRSVLAARVPAGRRDWIDGLLAYVTDCSPDDADHLVEAIRKVRKTV